MAGRSPFSGLLVLGRRPHLLLGTCPLTPEGVLGRHFQQRQRRSRAASDFLSSGPVTDIGGILMFFMYRDRFKV